MPLALAAAATLLLTAAAVPYAPPSALTAAGPAPLPLVIHVGMKPDCSETQTPAARVVIAPQHGRVAVRHGRLRRQGSACPAAPGFILMYVANRQFTGSDRVSIEVTEEGVVTTRAFEITVEPGAAPASTLINPDGLV